MTRLFIDDERDPVGFDWDVCRSYDETIAYLSSRSVAPDYISFDNDIQSGDKEGYHVAQWIIERDMDLKGKYIPKWFDFFTHSQNSVRSNGSTSISALIADYLDRKENGFFDDVWRD